MDVSVQIYHNILTSFNDLYLIIFFYRTDRTTRRDDDKINKNKTCRGVFQVLRQPHETVKDRFAVGVVLYHAVRVIATGNLHNVL